MPGGGGTTKSGVTNAIFVASDSKVPGTFEYLNSFPTGDLLCNSISTGSIRDTTIICASFDELCHLYSVKLENDGQLSFKQVAEFTADYCQDQASVNCSVIISRAGSAGYVITGGEDGKCRVWIATKQDNGIWLVSKKSELTGHTGPIMSLSVSSPQWDSSTTRVSGGVDEYWLVTGSRDGTIRMWNVRSSKLLNEIKLETINDSRAEAKEVVKRGRKIVPPTPAQLQLQCRGCVFSADASCLFYIQSASRGGTFLIKAELTANVKDINDRDGTAHIESDVGVGVGIELPRKSVIGTVSSKVMKYTVVSTTPSTRLRSSDWFTGHKAAQLLVVGGSDGSLSVFRQHDLSLVLRLSQVHDFPVTGLAFRPPSLGAQAIARLDLPERSEVLALIEKSAKDEVTLVSCSADNKFISVQVSTNKKKRSWCYLFAVSFFMFLFLLGLAIIFLEERHIEMMADIIEKTASVLPTSETVHNQHQALIPKNTDAEL